MKKGDKKPEWNGETDADMKGKGKVAERDHGGGGAGGSVEDDTRMEKTLR